MFSSCYLCKRDTYAKLTLFYNSKVSKHFSHDYIEAKIVVDLSGFTAFHPVSNKYYVEIILFCRDTAEIEIAKHAKNREIS